MLKPLGLAGALSATLVATTPVEAQRFGRGHLDRIQTSAREDLRRRDDLYGCRSAGSGGDVLGSIVSGLLGGSMSVGRGDSIGPARNAFAGRAMGREAGRRC